MTHEDMLAGDEADSQDALPKGSPYRVAPLKAEVRMPHPVVWMILYLPFGALGGYVSVALTNQASDHGISISDAALLIGAQMLMNWLKWLWAPIVDISLTPRAWYVISTLASAVGVVAMSMVPLDNAHLGLLVAIVAAANLINTMVGMSVEAMIGHAPAHQFGRISAWFQAGNLGGAGFGGGLGLYLLKNLIAPWMSGAIMAALFVACCFFLRYTPVVPASHKGKSVGRAVGGVVKDLGRMVKSRGGLLAAILCFLPIGTGAAAGVLTQDAVAGFWNATDEVAWVQGVLAGAVTAVGCFVGGYACERARPQRVYAAFGIFLAIVAVGMAVAPHRPIDYVVWNLVYSFGVGLTYSAFTAVVLDAMGAGSGATKYNIFASLANFPIWWLGLLLALVADKYGARSMLLTEAALGVIGVVAFAAAILFVRESRLPERPVEVP